MCTSCWVGRHGRIDCEAAGGQLAPSFIAPSFIEIRIPHGNTRLASRTSGVLKVLVVEALGVLGVDADALQRRKQDVAVPLRNHVDFLAVVVCVRGPIADEAQL